MYHYEEENKRNSQEALALKKKKQKQATMLIALLIVSGLAYFFLSHLPEEKTSAKEEIEKMLQDNWNVTADKLDQSLWEGSDSWEEYLEGLFLPSQVNSFKDKMIKAIDNKALELEEEEKDRPRKMREENIKEVEDLLEEEEKQMPDIQKLLEKYAEKINNTLINDLSSVTSKVKNLIWEKRDKRKRLYWKLPAQNWADRWLMRNQQSLKNIWNGMIKKEPNGKEVEPSYFDGRAIYRIQFPPSLWSSLTDEQQELAKKNGHGELTLRDEVQSYKFSPLVEEWENKVKPNPVRGEMDPNNLSELDNNALFYGAPRTGKSIMAEKLAFEADVYPLVVIQGSTLTPNKSNRDANIDVLLKLFFTISSISYDLADDYGLERTEDGEVRYILFLDEADQVCTNNFERPKDASTELTFLKECMGSDNKSEESKNLWIAATNHLDSINIAVYQAGRLSNPLCFSWTLGEFMYYASQANITNRFPQHWIDAPVLKDEDNQWVNRFNKIIFDKDFLPFWSKFINDSKTQEKLNEIKERNQQGEEIIKQKGIQWGEFFEFFWRLYDSKQLENFNGKFESPRELKMEETIEKASITIANKISKDISTRLYELNDTAKKTKTTIQNSQTTMTNDFNRKMERIIGCLNELGGRGSRYD